MQTFLLAALTMLAFAMNSVLNRAAVDGGHADPSSFAVIRVLAGAALLAVLVIGQGGRVDLSAPRRWAGAAALAVYMIGFSLAYQSLDAGLGALILFGTVQIALFAQAARAGAAPDGRQVLGAGIAFGGLLLALWPDGDAGGLVGAVAMVLAGLGWAGYTLAGRGADPLPATASHFVLCLPFVALLLLLPDRSVTGSGWGLAIASGAVTSGLGYALWYRVLPAFPGARAGILQLSVPVLAIGLGAVLLGEDVGWQIVLSAILVLGGIALALLKPAQPPADKT